MDWIQRMNLVLDYIENNLDNEIEENKISELSASPKGMFQRIFSVLTDMSLSEYIRKRRLTQAVFDIQNTNEKIIDIALKYGYSSVDAFSFAFKNFHGITPSDAKKPDIKIQSFYPFLFELKLFIKEGNDMQNRIIENVNVADVKVEIGRANKSDKEIVVELGKSKILNELKESIADNIIELDKKMAEPLDVLVNNQIAAKGIIVINNGIFNIKIIQVADSTNNILNLKLDDVIELDKKVSDPFDVLINNRLVAKGTALVIDENFGVRITERY